MNVEQLCNLLDRHPASALQFRLPSGAMVPDHFHVTEVGRVDKNFIDCGGNRRQTASCLLQTWTAEDVDHRLVCGKLAGIMRLAAPMLGTFDLPIEVEYGSETAIQYRASDAMILPGSVVISLTGKQTACLAPDKCGVDGCNPKSGCC